MEERKSEEMEEEDGEIEELYENLLNEIE